MTNRIESEELRNIKEDVLNDFKSLLKVGGNDINFVSIAKSKQEQIIVCTYPLTPIYRRWILIADTKDTGEIEEGAAGNLFIAIDKTKTGLVAYVLNHIGHITGIKNDYGITIYSQQFWDSYRLAMSNPDISTQELIIEYIRTNRDADGRTVRKGRKQFSIAICGEGLELGEMTTDSSIVYNEMFVDIDTDINEFMAVENHIINILQFNIKTALTLFDNNQTIINQ